MRTEHRSYVRHIEKFYQAHYWNPKRRGRKKDSRDSPYRARGQRMMVT